MKRTYLTIIVSLGFISTLLSLTIASGAIHINNKLISTQDNEIKNGGFESSTSFDDWEQLSWIPQGTASIDTGINSINKYANLTASTSINRIGYRQNVTNFSNESWTFYFKIKHDGGTLYKAGITLYYYNKSYDYMGRTYWYVSNEYGDTNNSENLYFDIRAQSDNQWLTISLNVSDPTYRPANAAILGEIGYFQPILHVYGVSGYGSGITVGFDDIQLTLTGKNERVKNGEFDNSDVSVDDWGLIPDSNIGIYTLETGDAPDGTNYVNLTASSSINRVRLWQAIDKIRSSTWLFSFAIRHNGGTLFAAGIQVFYYDKADVYMGHTCFRITNLCGEMNTSNSKTFIIRSQAQNQWYSDKVNISDPYYRPPDANDFDSISRFRILLSLYGVSGYGTGVEVHFDNVSLTNPADNADLFVNGDFENSLDFESWSLVQWPNPGSASIDNKIIPPIKPEPFKGNQYANLTVKNSSERIGYRQTTSAIKGTLGSWNLSFAIQHDGGTLYQAGIAIYYYDISFSYVGRTYWILSNEAGGNNDSENLYFDIRDQSIDQWYSGSYNLSNEEHRPSKANDLTKISHFEVIMHVYGVSNQGNGIEVYYDEVTLEFIEKEIPSSTITTTATTTTQITTGIEIAVILISCLPIVIVKLHSRKQKS